MSTTNEAVTPSTHSTPAPLTLAIRGKNGDAAFSYPITRAQFVALAGKVWEIERARSKEANTTSGGAVSGFLHAYGCKGEDAAKAGFTLEGWKFNEAEWLLATYPPVIELTPEQKKAAAEKRALTAKQAAWDKSVAPWIKKGMSVEELSHADLYGPRPSDTPAPVIEAPAPTEAPAQA